VRNGVFIIAGIHILLMGLLAAETIIHHGYQDEDWYKAMIGKLKHPSSTVQNIVLGSGVCIGNMFRFRSSLHTIRQSLCDSQRTQFFLWYALLIGFV